ncbi:MAG: molybdopterin-binding protein [Corynebacterium sp.]|nr:molybdopterin-binding protein [Corynebacterium sp.]
MKATVIVASTRAAAGTYTDCTGPVLVEWRRGRGLDVRDATVVADADIAAQVDRTLVDEQPTVLLTTGGTGVSPTDQTVAAVRPHLTHELPGLVTALQQRGVDAGVPTAVLSGGVAGVAGRTFVMTLPGSRGGVADGIAVLDPLLDHLLDQLLDRPTADHAGDHHG